MHRDANLRKRNALVIPGVLLATYGLIGSLYALLVRADSEPCGDGRYVELVYACRDAGLILALVTLLGLVLLALGALAFRSTSTCRLGHGSWSTSVLALLISLTVLPAVAAVAVYLTQDAASPYVILSGETEYRMDRLMGLAATAAFVALVPFFGLYVSQSRGHRCCREASCFTPCFCDEPASAPAAPAEPAWTAEEPEMMTAPTPEPPAPRSAPAAAPIPHVPVSPSTALSQWHPSQTVPSPARTAPAKPMAGKAAPAERKTRTVRKTPAKKPAKRGN